MKLEFDENQLFKLMKDFYTLTGIRVVLFDDEHHLLLSYPQTDCTFCRTIRQVPDLEEKCIQSDQLSFKQCESSRKLTLYQCHAGLVEASMPLINDHIVIGYLMFGQISNDDSKDALNKKLQTYLRTHHLPVPDIDVTSDIPVKTIDQIRAASTIMEAFTFYTLYNETIALRRQNFTNNFRNYLLEHLSENLDVDTIAFDLGISRSKLYTQCNKYLGIGIAEYIRSLRIEQAKKLLRETNKTITDISMDVGYADYNYFCRSFKKEVGYPAKKYRKLFHSDDESSSIQ